MPSGVCENIEFMSESHSYIGSSTCTVHVSVYSAAGELDCLRHGPEPDFYFNLQEAHT